MKTTKKTIVSILVIGIILKLAFAFFSYHPDSQALEMAATIMSQKHLWFNIYDYLPNLPHSHLLYSHYGPKVMNYPPLAYWFQAIWHQITSPLISKNINSVFIYGQVPLQEWGFNFLLLIFKLKYIFFDLAIGYLIFLITNKKLWPAMIWWFNPFTLYATYMIGQFDIIPLFFSLLAYYLATQKQKYFQAAFWLGTGGAFKIFPLLFVPFLVTQIKGFKKQVIAFLISFTAYFLPTIPFLHSYGYQTYAMIASQTDKIFYAKIMLTGAEYLSFFSLIYFFLITISYLNKTPLWLDFFAVMAVFFSLVHFHPQWIVFIIPWSIIYLHKMNKKYRERLIILFSILSLLFLLIILSFDASLSINLFSPLVHHQIVANNLTPLFVVNKHYPFHDFMSLIRTLWAGIWLGLLYQGYQEDYKK